MTSLAVLDTLNGFMVGSYVTARQDNTTGATVAPSERQKFRFRRKVDADMLLRLVATNTQRGAVNRDVFVRGMVEWILRVR